MKTKAVIQSVKYAFNKCHYHKCAQYIFQDKNHNKKIYCLQEINYTKMLIISNMLTLCKTTYIINQQDQKQ